VLYLASPDSFYLLLLSSSMKALRHLTCLPLGVSCPRAALLKKSTVDLKNPILAARITVGAVPRETAHRSGFPLCASFSPFASALVVLEASLSSLRFQIC